MNRKVVEVIVIIVALTAWFLANRNSTGTTKYAGAVVILAVIRVVGSSMKPKTAVKTTTNGSAAPHSDGR